jgi:hypothetical protein
MNDLRFDTDVRAEIWVTVDEIREHRRFAAVMEAQHTPEKRIELLKGIAQEIAVTKLTKSGGNGIEFSGSVFLADVNIDRIDWQELAKPNE